MSKLLIAYASKHGHTRKIAARLADVVRESGAQVDVFDLIHGPQPVITEYDVVVVGASIHAGHHQKEVVDWVRRRSIRLSAMPSAFFSVCLTAADETDEARSTSQRYIDEFLDDTGWRPTRTATFAGSLQYREYDFMTRLLIRLMMARGGHPTDTSQDYDYTDWDAVAAFANACVAMAPAPEPAAVP